ncbi:MAG: endonuclease/exonuclease/phosphatase family protein [Phycisphaeraceae bacterium]|nr:endonuclease/exonuclease/phosphatase family protein [Phycisphaeraceae bacterium]
MPSNVTITPPPAPSFPGRACRVFSGLVFVLVGVLAIFAHAQPPASGAPDTTRSPAAAHGPELTLVSFNIRYGTAPDGPDHWSVRRERVAATLADLRADVVGLQEALSFQVRELLEDIPAYAAVGVHRDDGRARGEACMILYDRTRFAVAESGVFWLSMTPDVPGSKSWDASLTRQCVWVRLLDNRTGHGIYIFNAHFDHRGQQSRVRSAELVLQEARRLSAREHRGDPVVFMGDLNAAETNPAVERLIAPGDTGWAFYDSYRVVHPHGRAGTFNAFNPENDGGDAKIDYIFVGPGLKVLDAAIDRRKVDGRYPSDHFPVIAHIAFEARPSEK